MSFDAIQEYDATTAANNDNIGGINVGTNCPFSNVNDAFWELTRQIKCAVANQGTDIASATTTDIGGASGQYVKVTGTTTITGLGTVAAGTMRWVEFSGALTLTHNASSLKLPTSANITTVAGDVGLFVSLGSGGWKCLHYQRGDGSPLSLGSVGTITSTDAGATEGPAFVADRNSASPAASDLIGALYLRGRDSGGNTTDYAKIKGKILDATNGSEDGAAILYTLVAGAETAIITSGPGVQIGSPTGGDPGAGKINVQSDIQVGGVSIASTVLQTQRASYTTYGTISTNIPDDDTIPQNTEGTQILSVTITPKSASSTIYIRANGLFGTNSTNNMVMALFKDSTANALSAASGNATTNWAVPVTLDYAEASGSTSARTYKLRVGPGNQGTGDMYTNGDNSARYFGGVAAITLTAEERL